MIFSRSYHYFIQCFVSLFLTISTIDLDLDSCWSEWGSNCFIYATVTAIRTGRFNLVKWRTFLPPLPTWDQHQVFFSLVYTWWDASKIDGCKNLLIWWRIVWGTINFMASNGETDCSSNPGYHPINCNCRQPGRFLISYRQLNSPPKKLKLKMCTLGWSPTLSPGEQIFSTGPYWPLYLWFFLGEPTEFMI